MTRSELINLIIEQCPYLENKEVENAINLFFSEIITGLTSGQRVELRGFGSFSIKSRAPQSCKKPSYGGKF